MDKYYLPKDQAEVHHIKDNVFVCWNLEELTPVTSSIETDEDGVETRIVRTKTLISRKSEPYIDFLSVRLSDQQPDGTRYYYESDYRPYQDGFSVQEARQFAIALAEAVDYITSIGSGTSFRRKDMVNPNE